jgi:sialate O-acetylesterase
MTRRRWTALVLFALMIAAVARTAVLADEAEDRPFLHPLFSDNMVLQRGIPAPIWGWTEPGREVTVRLQDKIARAVADAKGQWIAKLGPLSAGGPDTLTVTGPQSVTLNNVLVGDVWICSGQSNMEMGIGSVNDAEEEIASARHPQIRLFTVPKRIAVEPQSTVKGEWQVCSPKTIAEGGWNGFSAVGFFFGRELYKDLKVPIGLIHTSWGGTVAEAWTSAEALKTMSDFEPALASFREQVESQEKGDTDIEERIKRWLRQNDPGSAEGLGWADPSHETSGWKTMSLPATWEESGLPEFDGVVWFRKSFDLPEGWAGKDLTLELGPIDDRDTTWINGTEVGHTDQWDTPRVYKVPRDVLKSGRNVLAIRVLDTGGGGGIYGKPGQMRLRVAGEDRAEPVSLAGTWQYRDSASLARTPPVPQRMGGNANIVTVLYNGMIAPLVPFAIKGAIWYQGESNSGRADQYRTLLPTLIRDWRSRFGVGEFPFFIVQLANFMATKPEPGDSKWAELREAQLLTANNVPKTGLAVAIDIGDAKDIHPKNKQEVGRRLALAARAIAYDEPIEYAGPTYRSMEVKDNTIRLHLDHVGGGLVAKGGDKLQGFAIAGEDKHFVWADAVIDGDTVTVSSPKVDKPVAVRYAWADNPACNLSNKAGLPAPPFRTDGK